MAVATLTIDLDALASNWSALDAVSAPGVETGAVVKANGYGLGAEEVSKALADAGATSFFVAAAEEAVDVRNSVGDTPEIFIFSGHMSGDSDVLQNYRLTPLLNSVDQVHRHLSVLPDHGFGVQLDSGMNRLGLEPGDWNDVRDQVMSAGPNLVMSHLACADEPDHPMNVQQLAAFRGMTDGLPVRRSLAATGGILLGKDYHFDLTRPGVGLYGGQPFGTAKSVVEIDVPVIQTRTVLAGETVGYSNTFTAHDDMTVATISAGYADGLIRAMGAGATVFADGVACRVIGRVSMDMLTVDVSHLEHQPETLTLLGDAQSVDELAEAAGTIGYEILTSLGHRYSRIYLGGPE